MAKERARLLMMADDAAHKFLIRTLSEHDEDSAPVDRMLKDRLS